MGVCTGIARPLGTSAKGHLDGLGVLLSLLHLAGSGQGPLGLIPRSPVIGVLEVHGHAGCGLEKEDTAALGMLCSQMKPHPRPNYVGF